MRAFQYLNTLTKDKINKFVEIVKRRQQRWDNENLLFASREMPEVLFYNLLEAYHCYLLQLNIASYALIIRSGEIIVNYLLAEKLEIQDFNKLTFREKIRKLETGKILLPSQTKFLLSLNEQRNYVIHNVYIPTDKEIEAGFESILRLIRDLEFPIEHNTNYLPPFTDYLDKYPD